MKQFHLRVLPNDVTLMADAGTTILAVLQQAGLQPDAPCGGRGTCGKCKVWLDGQEVLSCQTVLERDCTVVLPRQHDAVILQPFDAGGGIFSSFEWEVWCEKRKGKGYVEIAESLGKSPKSVDNALQRIKKKIVAYLEK